MTRFARTIQIDNEALQLLQELVDSVPDRLFCAGAQIAGSRVTTPSIAFPRGPRGGYLEISSDWQETDGGLDYCALSATVVDAPTDVKIDRSEGYAKMCWPWCSIALPNVSVPIVRVAVLSDRNSVASEGISFDAAVLIEDGDGAVCVFRGVTTIEGGLVFSAEESTVRVECEGLHTRWKYP